MFTPCWKGARCMASCQCFETTTQRQDVSSCLSLHSPTKPGCGQKSKEQGPGQRPDITIDWADRLIHPRRIIRLNGKWACWKPTLRPNGRGLCRQTQHRAGFASRRRPTPGCQSVTLHSSPPLEAFFASTTAVPAVGLKTQLYWHRHVSATIRRVRRAASQQRIDTQTACTLQPLWPTSQWLHKLCRRCVASSFRLCSSCSHARPCIWRPILVHELCHAAALRHFRESTTLHQAHESGRGQYCMETTAMVGLVGTLALRPGFPPTPVVNQFRASVGHLLLFQSWSLSRRSLI